MQLVESWDVRESIKFGYGKVERLWLTSSLSSRYVIIMVTNEFPRYIELDIQRTAGRYGPFKKCNWFANGDYSHQCCWFGGLGWTLYCSLLKV